MIGILLAHVAYAGDLDGNEVVMPFVILLLLFTVFCWIWGLYSAIRYMGGGKITRTLTYLVMAELLVMCFVVLEVNEGKPGVQIIGAIILLIPNIVFATTALLRRAKKS